MFHLAIAFPGLKNTSYVRITDVLSIEDYPSSPPKVQIGSYLPHPNVFGDFLCLDMLHDIEYSGINP